MLPVLGVRSRHTVTATGRFHCPDCGGDRSYRLRRPRARFHLGHSPAVVECGTCSGRFPAAVLAVPTAERLAELLSRGLRTSAAYVLAGQHLAAAEGRRAVDVLQRSLGGGYTRDLFEADLASHREGSDLGVLAELAEHLRSLGKERLLRRLAELVVVLAHPGEPHWRRLGDVAAALDVSPAHLRGIVDDATARARE